MTRFSHNHNHNCSPRFLVAAEVQEPVQQLLSHSGCTPFPSYTHTPLEVSEPNNLWSHFNCIVEILQFLRLTRGESTKYALRHLSNVAERVRLGVGEWTAEWGERDVTHAECQRQQSIRRVHAGNAGNAAQLWQEVCSDATRRDATSHE